MNYLVIVVIAISIEYLGSCPCRIWVAGRFTRVEGVMGPSVLSSEPIDCYNLDFGQEVEQLLRILYRDV